MPEQDWLAEQFETNRTHLRAVASRMLGSRSEADDAVQEAWVRVSRADTNSVENLGGWLTTVVARVCLDQLRAHAARREDPAPLRVLEPVADERYDPEQTAALADAIGPALLAVLHALTPGERLAFVLHDMFGVSFEEIAPIAGCSSTAARQLASRGRRRVRGSSVIADADHARRQEIVSAFLAASHHQDYDALLAVLDPEIVMRADVTALQLGAAPEVRGARAVADVMKVWAKGAKPVVVNGQAGAFWAPGGKPLVVYGFVIEHGRIVGIDLIADTSRLEELDLERPANAS
jgi:RNA polymerase sigma-70 factor (ECF subfamily)